MTIITKKEFRPRKSMRWNWPARRWCWKPASWLNWPTPPSWSATATRWCWWRQRPPPGPATAWTFSRFPWTLKRSGMPSEGSRAASCAAKAVRLKRACWPPASSTGPSAPCSPAISETTWSSRRPSFPWTMTIPGSCRMIGTSAALSISDIPWSGPIGCLNVGYVDGNIVFNPTSEQRKVSKMDVTVAATGQKVGMIEAGADEIPEDIMYEGIVKAHEEIKKQVALINQMVASSARRSSLTSMRISTRSCSRISLPSDWKRPVSAWTRTTRTSARSAGTRLSAS